MDDSATATRQAFADLFRRIDRVATVVRHGWGPRLDRIEGGLDRARGNLPISKPSRVTVSDDTVTLNCKFVWRSWDRSGGNRRRVGRPRQVPRVLAREAIEYFRKVVGVRLLRPAKLLSIWRLQVLRLLSGRQPRKRAAVRLLTPGDTLLVA